MPQNQRHKTKMFHSLSPIRDTDCSGRPHHRRRSPGRRSVAIFPCSSSPIQSGKEYAVAPLSVLSGVCRMYFDKTINIRGKKKREHVRCQQYKDYGIENAPDECSARSLRRCRVGCAFPEEALTKLKRPGRFGIVHKSQLFTSVHKSQIKNCAGRRRMSRQRERFSYSAQTFSNQPTSVGIGRQGS